MTNRFLIAKYAPDLHRLEPKNIGVMLWTNHGVAIQFMPDEQARSFVNDMKVYRRWVSFWSKLCSQTSVSLYRKKSVPKTSARFLDAVRSTQKGNYLLYDAGILTEKVGRGDTKTAAKFLYDKLVAVPRLEVAAETESLHAVADEVLQTAGITEMPGYLSEPSIPCVVRNIPQQLRFDYGLVMDRGAPDALFLRVALGRQQSVTSGAFKFECVVEHASLLTKNRCIALVDADDSMEQDSSLRLLNELSRVVNVRDKMGAVREILSLGLAP